MRLAGGDLGIGVWSERIVLSLAEEGKSMLHRRLQVYFTVQSNDRAIWFLEVKTVKVWGSL
jgi:hypothetical protein